MFRKIMRMGAQDINKEIDSTNSSRLTEREDFHIITAFPKRKQHLELILWLLAATDRTQ
jgi:hypothetical protein